MIEKVKASTRIGANGKKTVVKAHTRTVKGKGNTSVVRHPRTVKSATDKMAEKDGSGDELKRLLAYKKSPEGKQEHSDAKAHAKEIGLKYDGIDEDGLHVFVGPKGDVRKEMSQRDLKHHAATVRANSKGMGYMDRTSSAASVEAKRGTMPDAVVKKISDSLGGNKKLDHKTEVLEDSRALQRKAYYAKNPADKKSANDELDAHNRKHGITMSAPDAKKDSGIPQMGKTMSKSILKHYGEKHAANTGMKYEGFKDGMQHFTTAKGGAMAMSQQTLILDPATHAKHGMSAAKIKKADPAKGRAAALASMAKTAKPSGDGKPRTENISKHYGEKFGAANGLTHKGFVNGKHTFASPNGDVRVTHKDVMNSSAVLGEGSTLSAAMLAKKGPKHSPATVTKKVRVASKSDASDESRAPKKGRASMDNPTYKGSPNDPDGSKAKAAARKKEAGATLKESFAKTKAANAKTRAKIKADKDSGNPKLPVNKMTRTMLASRKALKTQAAPNPSTTPIAKSVAGSKPTVAGSQFAKARAMKAATMVKSIMKPSANMKKNRKNERDDTRDFGRMTTVGQVSKAARANVKLQTETRGKNYFTRPDSDNMSMVKKVLRGPKGKLRGHMANV